MSKVIAVFGAGTGLGVSVARRFGREGYRVALVARRPEQLTALVTTLAAEGIEAAAFPADLRDTAGIPALIQAITEHWGRIDVIEYAPITTELSELMTPAAGLTPAALEPLVSLYLYTPVELIRTVLPAMLERGDGAILVGHGAAAVHPIPFRSGVGPAMAAARNYLGSLHGELADRGVYVGTLTVAAMIIGSAGHRFLTSSKAETGIDPAGIPTVNPADLADLLWEMSTKRDRFEEYHPRP